MLEIMVMSGPDDGRVIQLDPKAGHGRVGDDGAWTVVFGRRNDCDVSIPFDTQISRHHATLSLTPDGGMWLADSQSLNGTFIEKQRIESAAVLAHGQLFRLGRTWLRIQAGNSRQP